MSNAEPIGVAFVEVVPETTAFAALTQRQLTQQLAATRVTAPIVPTGNVAAATTKLEALAAATQAETVAATQTTEALGAKAVAEERAAGATLLHGKASREATEALLAETASVTGLRGASIGVNPVFLAATAAAIGFFESIKSADKFVEEMHRIEFATHASGAEMEQARATALALGRDLSIPATSALDAAEAIADLTHAGFDLADAQSAARDVLLLSSAAQIDLQDSTDITTRLLRAYRLEADQASQVTDTLTAATLSGAGTTNEWASALQTLAPLAHALGFDLQDTATLLIQAGQAGVSASQGTALLRLALARLSSESKPVKEGLHGIGLSLDDIKTKSGQLRPDAFVVLGEAIRRAGEDQAGANLATIFGARAGARLLPIVTQTAEQYRKAAEAAGESGRTQEEAAARVKSFSGSMHEAEAEASDLSITLGGLLVPTLTSAARGLTDIFHASNVTVGAIQRLVDPPRDASRSFRQLKQDLEDAQGDLRRFRQSSSDTPPPALKANIDAARKALAGLGDVTDIVSGKFDAFDLVAGGVTDTLGGLIDALNKASGAATSQNETDKFGQSLATQLAVAEASGNEDAQVRILKEQRANAIKRQQQARANPHLTPAQANAQITQAAQDQKTAQDKLQGILKGQATDTDKAARDAEKAARDIQTARDKHDSAVLTAIGQKEDRLQGRVTAAAADAALGNDIAAQKAIRRFYNRQVDEVRKTVHDQATAAAEIQRLRLGANAAGREITRLRKEQHDAAKTAATTARQNAVEAAQLDVQILEARFGEDLSKGETSRLVAAHQKVIAALVQARKHTRARSVEYKRLTLEIAQEQAAIAALRKTREKETTDAAGLKKQEFEFLQNVQGFTFSLLGNLIPGGSTSGLVGGSTAGGTSGGGSGAGGFSGGGSGGGGTFSSKGGGFTPGGVTGGSGGGIIDSIFPPALSAQEHGRGGGVDTSGSPTGKRGDSAGRTHGVTRAQGHTQIELLRKIHGALVGHRRGHEHPEAHAQRKRGSAALDYSYQGTHGM